MVGSQETKVRVGSIAKQESLVEDKRERNGKATLHADLLWLSVQTLKERRRALNAYLGRRNKFLAPS